MLLLDGESNRPLNRILLLILLLQFYNSIRNCHYLCCFAVVVPHEAPWRKLYKRADDTLFPHMMGLNRRAFRSLLQYLFDDDKIVPCCRRGRPHLLGPDGYLGLKMREYVDMVQAREPLADDVIGFMDGVSFQTECTSERVEQNAFDCGYDCNTMVNNVFAFGPDGKVFFAAVNFPGSWADGSLTAQFLHQMKRRIGRFKICVDQGFPRGVDAFGTFVGPVLKRHARHLQRDVRNYLLRISNVHTLLWQASEWGMRGMQGTSPRCKKRLPSDDEMR